MIVTEIRILMIQTARVLTQTPILTTRKVGAVLQ